ncbi:MAG TPA: ABC transporter substrate-binding protein [Nitrososphaeraceae archaeon]|nr:ABC transporter substrate-binding protein [Nitrososphaeraceae archaeon]
MTEISKVPIVLLLFLIVIVLSFTAANAVELNEKGAYTDNIRFIQYLDGNTALQEIKNGNLDTYYFRIPLEKVSSISNDTSLKIYEKNAGSFGFLLNPAPSNGSDVLNPFQFKEIRFAMNYLINREFVVDEILNGYGSVQIDPFGISSPEYEALIPILESYNFKYNPNLAKETIDKVLSANGAIKLEGKWTYKGAPILIKFMIRSDDLPRKLMGEILANQLDSTGFTVQRNYGDLNKANLIVYGTDPQELSWQIYTEGFGGTSAFVRYNPVIAAQMYSPYFGKMPGWANPSFWNYQNSTLDKITQSIEYSNFTTREERNELLRQAVSSGIQESVRIFAAQNIDPYVASSSIKGLINDFGAGISTSKSLINARSDKNATTINIGVKQIYQGAWNSVGGCSDIYCTNINSLVTDPSASRNPYTGEAVPLRTQWTNITTMGPEKRLAVDSDALKWNPRNQIWEKIGENTSKSKVTYNMIYSNWHNGQPMGKADLIYPLYFLYEWSSKTNSTDVTFDPEYAARAIIALQYLRGTKFLDDNNAISFVDYWHFDSKEIADFATPWATSPWEVNAAIERLVKNGNFAYTRSEATVKNIEWLSLIIPSHAQAIKLELEKMKSERFVPAALKDSATVEDAIKRYDASIKWIAEHNHAIIGNGPYEIKNYNPTGKVITLTAFRDSTYPFAKGYWSNFETPKLAKFEKVQQPKVVTSGLPLTITGNITIGGNYDSNASLTYFISDKSNRLVIQGEGEWIDNKGNFMITINGNATKGMSIGPNAFELFVKSNYALRPDIHSGVLITVPSTMTNN